MMCRFITVLIMVVLCGLSSACQWLAMPSSESRMESVVEEAEEEEDKFPTSPTKATVYIFRNQSFASELNIPIVVDGVYVANLRPMSFIVMDLEPGVHSIVSRTAKPHSVEINTRANTNYFVWQQLSLGLLSPRSTLELVDGHRGELMVEPLKLLETFK